MHHLLFILKTFKLLRQHQPWKLLLIFALTLLNGITAGFSIVLLIPLLQLLNIGDTEATGGPALLIRDLAAKAGLPLTLETILLTYVALLSLTALLQYRKALLDAAYQQTFIYRLRQRLFRKIILADWQHLNQKSKTNHLQVLTKEVPNLAYYYYCYLHLLTALIMTLSYTAWAMMVSVQFTVIVLLAGLLLFILLRSFLRRAFHLGEGAISSYNRLLKYIDDFWQTVKIAKVHSSEAFYYNKFDEASTSLLDLEYSMQRNHSLPQLIYRVGGILVLVFVVYAGYQTGQVPLASFLILILLFSRIFPQFTGLNSDISRIIANVPSVRMVMRLDDELADNGFHIQPGSEALPLEREIRLADIGFRYPDGEVLFSDFSATIPARQITAITGASGRGKTTLIDLIAGLQQTSSGRILVDGSALDGDLLPRWKRSIGYLPQHPFFIDGTLRENLVWDSHETAGDEQITQVLRQVNASHLMNRFPLGLDTFIANYAYSFSGGEQQRLALARVLLRKPQLLLLDEATSSLDPENEKQIMEVLSLLREKVTIILVSHRESVLPWCDKVISL